MAKRSAAAALLAGDVLEEVAHAQWVFVIPKMLRPYFMHHRELLGGLSRAALETVLELMIAAVGDASFYCYGSVLDNHEKVPGTHL